ncbi:MAG TPA: VWA domain-containing protein [Gemmatimonadales bacterium]|nr:VWA domain-containing protein [Gemmatimonadales bacterium]
MNALGFAAPVWLTALAVLLPLGAWFAVRAERRRQTALTAFGEEPVLLRSSPLPTRRRRWAGLGLKLAALALCGVALARPQLGERPAAIAREGRDVLVLLDLSRSMTVADVVPTRLAAAKRAVLDVIAATPNDRLGLVVFGGSAFLQLPLTADHASFRLFLDAAKPGDLGDPSTELAAALHAAARTFAHDGERGYQAAVLVSDGENGEDDVGPAIAELKKQEVPVFTIGVGTAAGGPVPADSSEAPERYHRDHIGRIVESRLEATDLRRIATQTGGLYARATNATEMLALAQGLGKLDVHALAVTKLRRHADRFQWPLAAALAVLLLEPLVRRARRRQLAYAAMLAGIGFSGVLAACDAAARAAHDGEQLYDAGKWAGAYDAFRRAQNAGGPPAMSFNAGNALYRSKRYELALKEYRELATAPMPLRVRAAYNLGNAAMRAAEDGDPGKKGDYYQQAVTAYEAALRLDPTDRDAKWNLELALRKLGEAPTGSSSGRGRRGEYGRGLQNAPGYEGAPQQAVGAMAGGGYGSGEGESAEELSEGQARQLLDAVQREQMSSHEGRPASGRGRGGDKDW